MKAEPEAGDGGLMEWIPRSCHFPQDIKHIAQVLNIENLKKTDVRTGPVASNSGKLLTMIAIKMSSQALFIDIKLNNCTSNVDMGSPGVPVSKQPFDLRVCSSWDSNEESDPHISTQQSVFTFCFPPHTSTQRPGRAQPGHPQKSMEEWEGPHGRRGGAQLEDDFIGSESDEVMQHLSLLLIFHATEVSSQNNYTKPNISTCLLFVNIRPCTGYTHLNYSTLSFSKGEEAFLDPGDGPQLPQDEDELRMLASLKREHEEEESRVALSESQIHQCHVSLSLSSEGTSTWTNLTMVCRTSTRYSLYSWMDVLSPPIMAPGQQADKRVIEENEEEYLNLLYDPCLNCYFDPKSGKYYELA
uniref:OCRE domain-containing protein n=1 Tax=Periophthalmus magnuspinnatus TaxID=409849 RepID=A0A3B4AXG4_9GOBI